MKNMSGLGLAGAKGQRPTAEPDRTGEELLLMEWLPAVLLLAGFALLWLWFLPRVKSGG
jgi:hypothetical protein